MLLIELDNMGKENEFRDSDWQLKLYTGQVRFYVCPTKNPLSRNHRAEISEK